MLPDDDSTRATPLGFPGLRAIDDEECAAAVAVLKRGALHRGAGLGEACEARACERLLAEYTGRRHALVLNSGTAALQAGLWALDIGPGAEVVVPAYGWLTNLTTVLERGARVVLAPVKDNLTIDEELLAGCFTDRTRAVVPIHACGAPAELARIRAIAGQHGVPLLDDASQALGATLDGRRIGGGRDVEISAFSFQAFKVVTCGEGGAVATDNEELYRRMVRYHDAGLARFGTLARNLAHDGEAEQPCGLGFNLRLSELAAAVLRVQLGKLPRILSQLAAAHARLREELAVLEAAALARIIAPRADATQNHAFLLLRTSSVAAAQQVAGLLRRAEYAAIIAAEDRWHSLAGWVRYLAKTRADFRVVDRAASEAVLGCTIVMQVNWQRSETERWQQSEALRRAVSSLARTAK